MSWRTSNGQNGAGVAGQAHSGANASGVLGLSNAGSGVRGQGEYVGASGTGTTVGVRGDGPHRSPGHRDQHRPAGTRRVLRCLVVGNELWRLLQLELRRRVGDGTNTATTGGGTYGLVARIPSGALGYAGYFYGSVHITGNIEKAGGTFKIDHPLEPTDRYLVHSFVEAPERLNVYSGSVTLDSTGSATVTLPRYFESANVDYRYQLTAVGAAAPSLHVSSKVKKNRFSSLAGPPGSRCRGS